MTCGIYVIKCIVTQKIYVGSSCNVISRLSKHRSLLRQNKHHSRKLQNAWNKYGEDSFNFSVYLECQRSELIQKEQECIDQFKAAVSGYNIAPNAQGLYGYKHTDEARANMSAAQKGHTVSAEGRENMRLGQTGKKQTKEQIEKRSATMKAKPRMPVDDPRRAAMADKNRQMVFTPEIKEKMRAAKLGKKRGPHSEETKAKMSESNKRVFTEGNRVANKAPRSEETKAKVSEGLRRYHENRRLSCVGH